VITVVVPWRAGCPHREAAWAYIRRCYEREHPGWQVIEGVCDGPWRKAVAVADGLSKADGDIVVVADADVWCDYTPAVRALHEGHPWAIPHLMVHRLTPAATAAVYDTGHLMGPALELPYRGRPGGGVVVLPRALIDEVPMDPRFTGWGHEDEAWATALKTVAGEPFRGVETLWHLWHPPQERPTRRKGSPESQRLYKRYRHATGDVARTRALLAEARSA
jgi:hypothetical protein